MDIKDLQINIRDPKVQKIAAAIILFVGVNYLYFFSDYMSFFFTPKKEEIAEKRGNYQRLAIKVAEAKRASENLKKLEKELDLLHEEWEYALSSLPEKKEIASLLRRVTLAGERSGVRFQLFEPQSVVFHGVYDEHPVNVKVEGGYHEVGAFFSRLNEMDRVVHVSGISLGAEKNDDDESVVRGEMVISAFTVPTQPADLDDDAAGGSKSNAKPQRDRIKGRAHGGKASPDDSDE